MTADDNARATGHALSDTQADALCRLRYSGDTRMHYNTARSLRALGLTVCVDGVTLLTAEGKRAAELLSVAAEYSPSHAEHVRTGVCLHAEDYATCYGCDPLAVEEAAHAEHAQRAEEAQERAELDALAVHDYTMLPADRLTWRTDLPTFRCCECGRECYASQQGLDSDRRETGSDDDVTDADIVNGWIFCLSCFDGVERPGEHVAPAAPTE
jgi:hypothetical protein